VPWEKVMIDSCTNLILLKMKIIFVIFLTFFSINAFGQIKEIKTLSGKVRDIKINSQADTSLKITYGNKPDTTLRPAIYLDGKHINSSITRTLNVKIITNIKIEKKYIELDGIKYYGQIFFETNKNYKFDFVSLSYIKSKYAELSDAPTLFMIDNELINDDYDKFILDNNYLLRINIETIKNSKAGIRFNLIRILTKKEENIKKVNEIRIRGDSTLTTGIE
jgi:hypothetical protein